MNDYKLYNKIDILSDKYYNNSLSDHKSFLIESRNLILKYIEDVFQDKEFLFASLSYLKKTSDSSKPEVKLIKDEIEEANGESGFHFHKIPSDDRNNFKEESDKRTKINNRFNVFIESINKDTSISLTEKLLNPKQTKNIAFEYVKSNKDKNSEKYENWNHFFLDLNSEISIDTAKEIGNTLKIEDVSKLKVYLENYRSICNIYSENSKDKIRIYFLKPSISRFEHNLLLCFATKNKRVDSNLLIKISLFLHRIISQTEIEKGEKLIEALIKNSLSSIVARGLSHSDGSHSMKYFEKNFIKLLEEAKEEKDRKILIKSFKDYNLHLRHVIELVADITGGLGKQTSYLYNFKDVLSSLNEKYFPNDNVPHIEDIKEHELPFLSRPIVDNQKTCSFSYNILKSEKNIMLPGGENGITAFLQILKSIYRNIFKHNLSSVKSKYIKLSFSLIDLLDSDKLKSDFYQLIITEQVTTSEDKYNILKSFVDRNILNNNNEIDSKAWGIKEIKIQAAYLIGLAIELINDIDYQSNYKFPADWYDVRWNKESEQIEHILYLKKAKKVLIISSDSSLVERENTSENNKKGIYFKFLENYDIKFWYDKINRDFEYVILDPDYFNDHIQSYKSRNFKILPYSEFIIKNIEKIDPIWFKKMYLKDNETCKSFYKSISHYFDESHSLEIIDESGFTRDSKKVKEEIWNKYDYYEALSRRDLSDFEKAICMKTKIAILDERLQDEFFSKKGEYIREIQKNNESETLTFLEVSI
jgi:hypothetical protein